MSDRLTRRSLIGGAAAGAAAASAPGASAARRRGPVRRSARVVIVGAGFAGLTAARELVRKGVRDVVVLEARNRVGGRTWTRRIGGVDYDVGGQWLKTEPSQFGWAQERITKLTEEVGVKTFKTYNDGQNVYYYDGTLQRYDSSGPFGPIPPDPTGVPDAFKAIQQINSMAKEVPLDAPWTAASAVEWDGQTFETWKLANAATPGGRFLLDLGVEAVWSCQPRDLSLLHLLWYTHGADTFDNLINTAGGAQDRRFVGGPGAVTRKLARQLGKRVVLRSPVRRIVRKGRKVRVESDRAIVTADHVIVAVPPAIAAKIEHRPGLPALRAQLEQRVPMGNVIKCQARYATPFWREDGLTGQATSNTGPVKVTFDNSPPDGGPGVMLGFIEGTDGRVWGERPAAQRKQAVLESFARYFGEKMLKPEFYVEKSWAADEWAGGCYTGYMPPGVLLDYGTALREPIGRVHWSGTETATRWSGYIDGAVQSGERAAAEVLEAL
jgi:monoamine oxidase